VRLEDALLCWVADLDACNRQQASSLCEQAIDGGVDIVVALSRRDGVSIVDAARAVAEVCRRDDAILMVCDDAELFAEVGADGLHVSGAGISFGQARATVGNAGLVGLSSQTVEDAMLALEVGADYLVHYGGPSSYSDFARMGAGGVPVFAAGLTEFEDFDGAVRLGCRRLCLEPDHPAVSSMREQAAELSRLLGRSI